MAGLHAQAPNLPGPVQRHPQRVPQHRLVVPAVKCTVAAAHLCDMLLLDPTVQLGPGIGPQVLGVCEDR